MKIAPIIVTCAMLAGCESITEGNVRLIRVAGTVRSADTGHPIIGAVVTLERTAFVFQGVIASDTSDADGEYRIEEEIRCKRNADLYLAPGDAYILVARGQGYDQLSNINIGAPLRCIDGQQLIDFPLRLHTIH